MENKQLRILLVAPMPRAGIPQYCHNLATHLAHLGHEVVLAAGVGYELAEYAKDYRLYEAFDRFRPRPVLMWRLISFIRTFRPDVIHFQGGQHPDALLMLWAMLRPWNRAKFVYTPQDLVSNNARSHHAAAFRKLCSKMEHVFFNSEDNRNEGLARTDLAPTNSSVLPVPDLMAFVRSDVTPEYPRDLPADSRLILCFGLIEPRKGIPNLIRALHLLRDRVPDAVVAVVGQALMDMESVYALVKELGLESRCIIEPEYVSFERMAGYFLRSSMIALPYESGWNSGVTAVAYGFGKPIVATAVGDSESVVEAGKTGLLVPPKNPEALADAIERVLVDKELQDDMAAGISAAAQRFPWSDVAERTVEVYRRVMG